MMNFKKHFYVCVYVFMCVEFLRIHTGAKGQLWASTSRMYPSIFRQGLSFPWSPPIRLDWIANKPQGFPSPPPQC